MSDGAEIQLEPRIEVALEELARLILERYPTASFRVSYGDTPSRIWLTAYTDEDDFDPVYDLVSDRLGELLIDEGLSIGVHPTSRHALAKLFGVRTDDEYAAREWVPSRPFHVRVPTGG